LAYLGHGSAALSIIDGDRQAGEGHAHDHVVGNRDHTRLKNSPLPSLALRRTLRQCGFGAKQNARQKRTAASQKNQPRKPPGRSVMAATLVSNVMIWDGEEDARFAGEVLIEGNRIQAVARGASQIARDRASGVIDGGGMTLMPGLVEGH
jgi:hypothetical protein